ncbi:MAG: O-linked N-acetylglucosamine transferase, SPINDLY family protein, partial [Acidiferrobacterales bacterium]
MALLQGNRLADARSVFEQVCRIDKDDVNSWICLVQINAQLGQPGRVEQCCREIIRIQPDSHEAHYHLGCALLFQGKQAEATVVFQRAASLKSDHAPTHMQLGHLSVSPAEALRHYQEAARIAPGFADAHAAVGTALASGGRVAEAVSGFRQALRLNPALYGVHSALLFTLNYSTAHDARALRSEHVHWSRVHGLPAGPPHPNTPDASRRLRVGYVSPDLREHSVAYFFEPLLAHHTADQIETFCYAEVAQPDVITERLQSLSEHWLSTCGLSDAALAERIRNDRIDILVDLAGHSSNNRLRTFSAKPAPVQITWLGYPNTTGLTAMGYRFTDAWADPPGDSETHHTERLVRLPHGFLCYLPPSNASAVLPPP